MKHYQLLALLMLILVGPVLAADPLTHVVQRGETLYGIARQYGLGVDAIMAANNIKDASKVQSGARLLIPGQLSPKTEASPTVSYTVQKGDTLYSISRKFGTSTDSIQKTNNLRGTTIHPGQVLSIPEVLGAGDSSGVAGAGAGTTGISTATASTATASTTTAGTTRTATTTASNPASTQAPATPAPGVPSTPVTVKTPVWPVSGTVSYLQGKLKGATISAQPGDSLIAVRAGTVISAGPFRGFGRVAFVQASDGLVYVYGGAASLNVRVGDSVRRGTAVGVLDGGEESVAYFFVFKGQDAIDPASAPRD
jgi:LysM repeat protein